MPMKPGGEQAGDRLIVRAQDFVPLVDGDA
jgi:hypothetical protein